MRESTDVDTIRQGVAMPQLVFEFWSQEIQPVVEAIERVLDARPTRNAAATKSLQYEPTQHGLDWAAHQISAGQLSSFSLHPLNGGIRYALLNGPGIGGDKRPGYMGTIEYTLPDYIHIWNELLQVNGLGMVCLGHEEGLEFTDEQFTPEDFPWHDNVLVIGAVRSPIGDWIQKPGRNYFSPIDA
jgi:hypothetical protein